MVSNAPEAIESGRSREIRLTSTLVVRPWPPAPLDPPWPSIRQEWYSVDRVCSVSALEGEIVAMTTVLASGRVKHSFRIWVSLWSR